MGIIDAYGEFELPEEKTKIEVIENSANIILATYEMYIKRANKKYEGIRTLYELYDHAENCLKEKERLKFNGQQIPKILNEIKSKPAENNENWEVIPSLFLSALQNTFLDVLIIQNFSTLNNIGFRLKENKTLILGKNTRAYNLGFYFGDVQGNIINNGIAQYMSESCAGGLHVNNGKTLVLGNFAKNGIYINNGETRGFCDAARETVNINNGTLIRTPINYGTPIIDNTVSKLRIAGQNHERPYSYDLKKRLDNKIEEIEFTKTLDELPYEEQIRKVKEFDWQKFEKETTEIAEEIKEAYKKCA